MSRWYINTSSGLTWEHSSLSDGHDGIFHLVYFLSQCFSRITQLFNLWSVLIGSKRLKFRVWVAIDRAWWATQAHIICWLLHHGRVDGGVGQQVLLVPTVTVDNLMVLGVCSVARQVLRRISLIRIIWGLIWGYRRSLIAAIIKEHLLRWVLSVLHW